MKVATKLMLLNDQNEKFFGEGPYRLLRGVGETGSLRSAAMAMGISYAKSLKILKTAEQSLGFPLTIRSIGGRGGGGSLLTPEAVAWLAKYEAYRDACMTANQALFREHFPRIGCVVMASGLGKRFGGNKLMADFEGQPLIGTTLDVTEGLFAHRVVVTRSHEVSDLCRKRGIEVILHDFPHRSDAVRLGIQALEGMDGYMFCLGDQPLLRRETVRELIGCWEGDRGCIWRTAVQTEPGSPVLFPEWAVPELLNLPEGKGGGWVIQNHPDKLRTLSVSDPYELMDVDTGEDLRFLQTVSRKNADKG